MKETSSTFINCLIIEIFRLFLLISILSSCINFQTSAFFIDTKQSPKTSDWNYNDQTGWNNLHRDCAGRAQSPIDIQHKNVIISQHLKLQFYNYDQELKFKLSNAHHTIKMDPVGPAYEPSSSSPSLDGNGNAGAIESGLRRLSISNGSDPIHDIITADEYVEVAPIPAGTGMAAGQTNVGPNNLEVSAPQSKVSPIGREHNERLVGLSSDELDDNQGSLPRRLSSSPQFDTNTRGQFKPMSQPNINNNNNNNNNDNNLDLETEKQPGSSEPYGGAPTIKLDWLDDGNNEYKLRDIHFHWAERRDNGSEHAIDGRRAAMEMHLVHIKHGLDKSKIGFTSDSVAVIAILIESHRKSNADFNPIVNELARINTTEQAQLINYKSIYDLLPGNLDAFYTYSGSLTTPPCYQVVNWIVMAERLNMNAKQIEMFRNLYAPPAAHHDNDEEDNNNSDHDDDNQHRNKEAHYINGGRNHNDAYDNHGRRQKPSNSFRVIKPNHQNFQSLSENYARDDDVNREETIEHNIKQSLVEPIMPNVRSIQQLNNRTILASFTKYGNRLKAVNLNNYSNSIHQQVNMYQLNLFIVMLLLVQTMCSYNSSNRLSIKSLAIQ